ncbi:thioredoxin reductase (NADPH) [Pseudonocardia sediminis]|uniref:Thioredoxin reductase (NADPH) n=1 Tax=Pseudonocardia sediminis TaxID=1397368 RepID=A0A4Q7UV44_PSEST|nr:NAD(P)/FAD-dependent oxidoreductase [Pseudonocardia sediminis]RZT85645.1 thioredoxin reductase (NADPH) [Pseudonocardia sediminis]
MPDNDPNHDVVIVGGGVGGLSAALMLARARRRVTCVDAGSPRNTAAEHVHGFLSRDEASPAELLAGGAAEVRHYGGELITGTARRIAGDGNRGFVVELDDRRRLTARAVIAATGLRDELPPIPGLAARWGHTVLHCPYCHGFEVRDAPLIVLGGQNRPFTLHQVQLVRQWSAAVVFATNGIELDGNERERLTARGIEVIDTPVTAVIDHDRTPVAVEFADHRVLPGAAVFVGPRFLPRDEVLTELGCTREASGALAVDATGQTSVTGLWAVGNLARDTQAIVSAASGVTAAIAANHHLLAHDIDRAVTEHRSPV